jgi:hypothetical protein
MRSKLVLVRDSQAVLAAIFYLALALALLGGLYSLVRGGSFLAAVVAAIPWSFAAAIAFTIVAAVVEGVMCAVKGARPGHRRATASLHS